MNPPHADDLVAADQLGGVVEALGRLLGQEVGELEVVVGDDRPVVVGDRRAGYPLAAHDIVYHLRHQQLPGVGQGPGAHLVGEPAGRVSPLQGLLGQGQVRLDHRRACLPVVGADHLQQDAVAAADRLQGRLDVLLGVGSLPYHHVGQREHAPLVPGERGREDRHHLGAVGGHLAYPAYDIRYEPAVLPDGASAELCHHKLSHGSDCPRPTN